MKIIFVLKVSVILLWLTYSTEALCPKLTNKDIKSHTENCMNILRISALEQSEFSVENLLEYLQLKEVKNRDIIVKQAILESGWFKSSLTTKYNNLFGMCKPRSRKTLASGVAFRYTVEYPTDTITYTYAKFEHWTDSVKDLLLLHEYYENRGYSTIDYYTFLNDIGYAFESHYIKALKSIKLNKELKRLNNVRFT